MFFGAGYLAGGLFFHFLYLLIFFCCRLPGRWGGQLSGRLWGADGLRVSKNNVLQLLFSFSNMLPWVVLLKKILQSELEEEKHCLESSPGDMVAAGQISLEFTQGEKKVRSN